MYVTVSEIFEELNNAGSIKNKKKEILEKYKDHQGMLGILKGVFDSSVKFNDFPIPQWTPNPSPIGLTESTLAHEMRRIYMFVKGAKGTEHIDDIKRQQIFRDIVECIPVAEAVIFQDMFSYKADCDINSAEIKKVFPTLLKTPRKVDKKK